MDIEDCLENIIVTSDELSINNRIIIGVLYNYSDETADDSDFVKIDLPELCLSLDIFIKLFYPDSLGLSTKSLDKLYGCTKNMSLSNNYFEAYISKNGSLNKLSSLDKIKVYKECFNQKITSTIKKQISLTLDEFKILLSTSKNGQIHIGIQINLLSATLNVGQKILFNFKITDIPLEMINEDDRILFDFAHFIHKKR